VGPTQEVLRVCQVEPKPNFDSGWAILRGRHPMQCHHGIKEFCFPVPYRTVLVEPSMHWLDHLRSQMGSDLQWMMQLYFLGPSTAEHPAR